MEETRGGQVAFGWVGEGGSAAQERPSTSRPLRGRYARGERGETEASAARASTGSARAEPTPLPPDDELWDVRAAARFLKRSVSWVYHRAEDGTLPVKRLAGWGVRFIPAELRAWVRDGGVRRGR